MKTPEHGEVYWASLEGSGRHPVIVVSRQQLNRGHYVVVVPVTSRKFEERVKMPTCVALRAGRFGFTADCVAQAENVTLLEKGWIDAESGPLGRLDRESMRGLVHAIGYVIDAECEPA